MVVWLIVVAVDGLAIVNRQAISSHSIDPVIPGFNQDQHDKTYNCII